MLNGSLLLSHFGHFPMDILHVQDHCTARFTQQRVHRLTTPYLSCLHNHLSNPPVSSPFGTSFLAVFHLVEAPKLMWPAGFSIKFFTFRVAGLSSPSQITLDLCALSAKTLARAWSP